MPTKDHIAKLRHHKPSARPVVVIGGRHRYVGPRGSEQAQQRYDELTARWMANGRMLGGIENDVTVSELILRYYEHCETYYAHRRTFQQELADQTEAAIVRDAKRRRRAGFERKLQARS